MAGDLILPAEWAPQRAVWTAWPWDLREWGGDIAGPRAAIAAMARALGGRMCVLARPGEPLESAQSALAGVAEVIAGAYGDVWLRDIGPIFARRGEQRIALGFRTNGWGGKFVMAGDETVAEQIATHAGAMLLGHDFVLEGGAIDHDGEGTFLTTEQCLLHPNRNGWNKAQAEAALRDHLGARCVLWLGQGLANDHTDGHVDNLARFIAPGRVVCQGAAAGDPNAETLAQIEASLRKMRDGAGRALEVMVIPGPGAVLDQDGAPAPASHMNFIIGQEAVVVPVYNERGAAAVAALAPCFPGRRVEGVDARALLAGGGAFHCITQQEPQ